MAATSLVRNLRSLAVAAGMPKRSKSSARWLQRHRRDRFAEAARHGGQHSRAYFKLAQIDERFKLVRTDQWVLELGAAPGGWNAYLAKRITTGRIIALDARPMAASGACVQIIQGCLGDDVVETRLQAVLAEAGQSRPLDLVLSDMAPNVSGVRAVDQAQAMELAELASEAAARWLVGGGDLVVKLMQGEGVDAWVEKARRMFKTVRLVKPQASRPESRETYAVALGFRHPL